MHLHPVVPTRSSVVVRTWWERGSCAFHILIISYDLCQPRLSVDGVNL